MRIPFGRKQFATFISNSFKGIEGLAKRIVKAAKGAVPRAKKLLVSTLKPKQINLEDRNLNHVKSSGDRNQIFSSQILKWQGIILAKPESIGGFDCYSDRQYAEELRSPVQNERIKALNVMKKELHSACRNIRKNDVQVDLKLLINVIEKDFHGLDDAKNEVLDAIDEVIDRRLNP